MKTSYLVLEFNGCSTTIEILNTPVAKKWLEAYNLNKSLGLFDYIPTVNYALLHHTYNEPENHSDYNVSDEYCVERLNTAIHDVMWSIAGEYFPHLAYVGMSFDQTNLIHRCFTTAAATHTNWEHNINPQDLSAFKKLQYENPDGILEMINKPQFRVHNFEKFEDALHRINKWVHVYEGFLQSVNTQNTFTEINDDSGHIFLDWNNFNSSHVQLDVQGVRTSYEEVVQSFPNNYEDYDVVLGKFILGKDYETAFSEYDNPLEFDITNIDGITGVLRIHYSKNFKRLYDYSEFTRWAKSYGLTEELFLPPPIGKIVDSSCDFSKLEVNHTSPERWSSGRAKPYPPFDSLNSYIMEK